MSNIKYFDLSIPAPKRLAMMRADYANHAKRYPHCPEHVKPADWRAMRRTTFKSYSGYFGRASRGLNNDGPILYGFDEQSFPVRSIRRAYDVDGSGIKYRGYYADDDRTQGLIVPIVANLPHGRYLSGYHWTDNDERVLFLSTVFDDESEAAHDADDESARFAESCREDNARFCAMQDAEQLVEDQESDLHEEWATYKAAWSAYLANPPRFAKAARQARESVRGLIENIRASRVELETARRAYEE